MEYPILETRGLYKSYGSAAVIADMNISLPRGKTIGLLGPNGSGKSTFIKLAAGLLTPTAGAVLIDGREPDEETRAYVSYLPERTYFDSAVRVSDAVDMFHDFYADFDRQRALEMTSRLGVDVSARFGTLSKGTKEKLQLILVMSRAARLFLLDEPIGGVDPAARDFILKTIFANKPPTSTVLVSTHLIADVENVLDEFMFMMNGRIVLHSTVEDVHKRQNKTVDRLFREMFRC